jgi:hypothetical protein
MPFISGGSMSEQNKVKIPFGKVAGFVSKLILKSKSGFTKEEGEEILSDFIELLSEVLKDNTKL